MPAKLSVVALLCACTRKINRLAACAATLAPVTQRRRSMQRYHTVSKRVTQLLFVSPPAWLCCRAGTYNPAKLFGVTTLDVARSRAFIGQILEVDPAKVDIPVIGGHAGEGS